MRLLFILLAFICGTFIHGQSPCEKVKLADKLWVLQDKPFFPRLRKIEVNLVPDSVKNSIEKNIKAATYEGFFNTLTIKEVRRYDSLVKKASVRQEPIYDSESNEIDFLYSVHYETKLSNQIPFIFRVDFKRNGELFKEEQLWNFQYKNNNIISCERAISIALTDTINTIKTIENIYLYYSIIDKSIVWQVEEAVVNKTGNVKVIDTYSGDIIRREFIKKADEPLFDSKIKQN